jgi:hypothetical protein
MERAITAWQDDQETSSWNKLAFYTLDVLMIIYRSENQAIKTGCWNKDSMHFKAANQYVQPFLP